MQSIDYVSRPPRIYRSALGAQGERETINQPPGAKRKPELCLRAIYPKVGEIRNSLSGRWRMIGPTVVSRHLHAFDHQRRYFWSTLAMLRLPGFSIGEIQAKFGEAAEQENAGP